MTSYTEDALVQKLSRLVDTQDSITILSQWLMYHRKHAAASVQTWAREMKKAAAHRKLCFMYLANDVIQNSRRKGEEFVKEFGTVLPDAISHAYRHTPKDVQARLLRLLSIFEERSIYTPGYLQSIRNRLKGSDSNNGGSSAGIPDEGKHLVSLLEGVKKNELARMSLAEKVKVLPGKLFVEGYAEKMNDKESVENAVKTATSAHQKVEQYHRSLTRDVEERTKLIEELRKLIAKQELYISGTQATIQECQTKMDTLVSIQHDLEQAQSRLVEPDKVEPDKVDPETGGATASGSESPTVDGIGDSVMAENVHEPERAHEEYDPDDAGATSFIRGRSESGDLSVDDTGGANQTGIVVQEKEPDVTADAEGNGGIVSGSPTLRLPLANGATIPNLAALLETAANIDWAALQQS
ncbi:Regulation of nuclear pre-mRNA domain containing protein 1B [Borealophlyctis nickersoniae]|nr:Regulation of nuclear pre-mRNA domain containing protein 1B [Borealophlyctis nickersoniae]